MWYHVSRNRIAGRAIRLEITNQCTSLCQKNCTITMCTTPVCRRLHTPLPLQLANKGNGKHALARQHFQLGRAIPGLYIPVQTHPKMEPLHSCETGLPAKNGLTLTPQSAAHAHGLHDAVPHFADCCPPATKNIRHLPTVYRSLRSLACAPHVPPDACQVHLSAAAHSAISRQASPPSDVHPVICMPCHCRTAHVQ